MKWKSRELLYDLYLADTENEVVEAFKKCEKMKI